MTAQDRFVFSSCGSRENKLGQQDNGFRSGACNGGWKLPGEKCARCVIAESVPVRLDAITLLSISQKR